MLVASLSQCSTDLLVSSAASAHMHTVMSVHVCTGSTNAVFSLCCWHCWWASGSIWSVRFGFVICRLNAISNVFSTSLNLLSSSTPKKRDGYSQPRQPAWTNRYLSKVHWWIYSVLLTTEISNNLSEMPNPMLDISCALTPHLLFSDSWCQLQPPHTPHTSVPLQAHPSVDDYVRADQSHSFCDLMASLDYTWLTEELKVPPLNASSYL